MTATRKLYEIRKFEGARHSVAMSPKLRERTRATKLKNYLRKRLGIEAFSVGIAVAR